MKTVQNFFKLLCLTLLSVSFSQCASTMKLQKEAPTTFGETYFQEWVAGVQGGGFGINVFIQVNDKNVILDSIYFRGEVTELKTKPANASLFIGRFKGEANTQEPSLITTTDEKVEEVDFPFNLKENECVVSYKDGDKLKYFKITDMKEKPLEALPMSAPPNKN